MSNQELAVGEEVQEEIVANTSENLPPEGTSESDTEEETIKNENNESLEASATAPAAEQTETSLDIHSLKAGQRLTGKVKNIAQFGAFVDVGIPQDGLVHISKLARHKVDKVSDVVSEGQEIEVWVKKVDTKRGRLSLTMIKPVQRRLRDIEEETELEGTITRLESYGAFVDIDSDRDGLVHISQITHEYIKHPEEALKVGDKVNVKVLSVNRKKRQVDLSIKALLPEPVKEELPETKFQREERPRNRRQKEAKRKEEVIAEVSSDEPMVTAMAVAYAALQEDKSDDEESVKQQAINSGKAKRQKNHELDAIVARTLADREKS
jgi:transcriptional accessory protein Tex/SPT6